MIFVFPFLIKDTSFLSFNKAFVCILSLKDKKRSAFIKKKVRKSLPFKFMFCKLKNLFFKLILGPATKELEKLDRSNLRVFWPHRELKVRIRIVHFVKFVEKTLLEITLIT